jgi:hypothetical protein
MFLAPKEPAVEGMVLVSFLLAWVLLLFTPFGREFPSQNTPRRTQHWALKKHFEGVGFKSAHSQPVNTCCCRIVLKYGLVVCRKKLRDVRNERFLFVIS